MPTDAELKAFLEKDGDFNCPPITENTRPILMKRYNDKKTKASKNRSQAPSIRNRKPNEDNSRALLDYSSAEDEIPGRSKISEEINRRNKKRVSNTKRSSREAASAAVNHLNGRLNNEKSALLNYSEGEEDDTAEKLHRGRRGGQGLRRNHKQNSLHVNDDDDEDDIVQVDDDLYNDDDDDDEEEEEEEVEEEEEEEEDEGDEYESMDIGVQTSPSSDLSTSIHNGLNSDVLRRRGKSISGAGQNEDPRFSSSTPLSPIRSTSSYVHPSSLHGSATVPTPPRALPMGRRAPPARATNYSLSSAALRRTIAAKDFGSLSEALATLPTPPPPPTPYSSTSQSQHYSSTPYRPMTTAAGRLQGFANGGNSFLTQAGVPEDPKDSSGGGSFSKSSAASSSNLSSNGGAGSSFFSVTGDSRNSHLISKFIITVVIVFFGFVVLKYTSLRPSADITHRLPICGDARNADVLCIDEGEQDRVTQLFKEIVSILNEHGVDQLCKDDLSSASLSAQDGTRRRTLTRQVVLSQLADKHYEGTDLAVMKDTFETLITLLTKNPSWGIRVVHTDGDIENTEMSLDYPSLDWSCWIKRHMLTGYALTKAVAVYVLTAAISVGFVYCLYKLFIWHKERKLQEHQEVFELVEQVLSLLVTQKQTEQNRVRRGGGHTRPIFVPVNYIRDQLIPPQDRKRKKKIWEKVVKYVRDTESRVREDVTQICGEEHRVWQWMPDIHWNPAAVSPGMPNPFVPLPPPPSLSPISPLSHFPAASPSSPAPVAPTGARSIPLQPPLPPASHATAGCGLPATPSPPPAALWQGSAFSALNRNVASPAVAPTSCLKVRNLLTQRGAGGGSGIGSAWMWQVKEEVLRRCCSAPNSPSIVHIAVDTQSAEGCVYIKCLSSDDAGKVFKTLHGQWYRGELVSVKYLREERYHERFPDARYQVSALKPQST